jgi:hypothetical protein
MPTEENNINVENVYSYQIEQSIPEPDDTDLEEFYDDEENLPFEERDLEDIVNLYETEEPIKYKDTVYVANFGFFKKDDPRIVEDVIYKHKLILDRNLTFKIYSSVYAIYDDIDAKGNLINPSYTVIYPIQNKNYLKVNNESHIYSDHCYLSTNFLKNNIFNYYYKECLSTGVFYNTHTDKVTPDMFVKKPYVCYRKSKHSKGFNALHENKPMTYVKMLGKKYTWGVEIETSSGYLPEYLDDMLVYDAVHDGSLRDEEGNVYGGEYVTGVLRGDLGLQQLKLLCNELSKRCMINKKCGVHVHIGGATFNKESVILMFYLYKKMESAIFGMLPESRRNNEYCRKLPELGINIDLIKSNREYYIDLYYSNIMRYLSSGYELNHSVNKKKDHPKGFKCGYDHNTARYCWVNFIPAVFNTRKNQIYTIEFRPHSASTSYNKIKNWLFICIALIDVVENHKNEIYKNPNITLNEIIRLVYPNNFTNLIDYIEKRTLKFSDKSIDQEASDYTDNEVTNDLTLKSL